VLLGGVEGPSGPASSAAVKAFPIAGASTRVRIAGSLHRPGSGSLDRCIDPGPDRWIAASTRVRIAGVRIAGSDAVAACEPCVMVATKRKRTPKATPRPQPKPAARAKAKRAAKPLKSAPTAASAGTFLASLPPAVRDDCAKLDRWMRAATGSPGIMYGASIVGYGASTIRYADGREAPWMKLGFAPRAQALALYGVVSAAPALLLAKLGKHTTGKGCLYIKRLDDVDEGTLRALLAAAAT
jgi:hypothetical protein